MPHGLCSLLLPICCDLKACVLLVGFRGFDLIMQSHRMRRWPRARSPQPPSPQPPCMQAIHSLLRRGLRGAILDTFWPQPLLDSAEQFAASIVGAFCCLARR